MKIVIAWIVTISLPFVCSEKEALVEWERNSNDQNHMVVSTIDGKVYFVKWSRILYKPEDIKKVRKIIETRG